MNIHEYQAKIILSQFGIHIPDLAVVSSVEEVNQIIDEMGIEQAVIKVQVHAGGRGKAGGVKIARNRHEIMTHARQLLGMKIINNQTGPEGVIANQILISPLFDIKHEYYIGAVIDRKKAQAMLIASPAGGMDIEEVAANNPEKIMTLPI
jgi:succinyl-CoA synthetase beta subunit